MEISHSVGHFPKLCVNLIHSWINAIQRIHIEQLLEVRDYCKQGW